MNKFFVVVKHTFLTKVRSKSFIISTVLMLLITFGVSNINKIIDFFDDGKAERIAVVDETGQFFDSLKSTMKQMKSDIVLQERDDLEKVKEDAKQGEIEAYLLIQMDGQQPVCTFATNDLANSSQIGQLETAMQQVKTAYNSQLLKITNADLTQLFEKIEFHKEAVQKDAKSEEEMNQARGLVYILLFVIYFMVLIYATMISTEVATEKTSRVMEVLISSASPVQQMFAKITGVGLLAVVQLALFVGVGYTSMRNNLGSDSSALGDYFGFSQLPISTVVYAVIFAILGFLLYATMAALLGSLVARVEDVQQATGPMTLLVVAGFMIAMFGLATPDVGFVFWTSFIPFFTPMILFMRIGLTEVPIWQIALGIGLLIGTIAILAFAAARVYKGGVMMYNRTGTWKDMKRAWNLTKNE